MKRPRLPTLAELAWLKDSASYLSEYNAEQARERRDRRLLPAPTKRQMTTAFEILRRIKRVRPTSSTGTARQRGVLLADDVGLGKTAVGAIVAGVFAGRGFRVRILAPNAPMARRWLDELRSHQTVLRDFGYSFEVSDRIRKLRERRIAISTHWRSVNSGRLACDLLIIDEAHRAKNDGSVFAQELRRQKDVIGSVLILTATPFSIAPAELARMLGLVGADQNVADTIYQAGDALDTLWRGKFSDPGFADELVRACSSAIDAIQPYVIRHGVATLSALEQRLFGVTTVSPLASKTATEAQKEILIRADRTFALGKRTGSWSMTRTNDPRFHVGWNQLRKELEAVDHDGHGAQGERDVQQLHIRKIRTLLTREGDLPKMVATGENVLEIVRDNERVVLFCDHHETARELGLHLGRRLRDELPMKVAGRLPWEEAYSRACSFLAEGRAQSRALEGFLAWLSSDGIAAQVASWLPGNARTAEQIAKALTKVTPRRAASRTGATPIAIEAEYLWNRIRQSSSSRQLFAMSGDSVTGADLHAHRIVAVTEPPTRCNVTDRAIFHPGSPDTVLSLFNSPFGPDVLVATDAFSEGFDLHRYCRYVIHYELDPSPMRTIQRNGRLRRVDCWAARTGKPLVIGYPVFKGTRDERLVETMQGRLTQFDLLLGGIGSDIQKEASDMESRRRQDEVLDVARKKLSRRARVLCVSKVRKS
jgi:SNF2-related domain/Helicase conserved C-terminal domain